MKVCCSCSLLKDNSEFYPRRERKNGLRSSCIVCSKRKVDQWRRRHLAHVANYKRKYNTRPLGAWQVIRANAKRKGLVVVAYEEFQPWYTSQKRVCHYCGTSEVALHNLPAPYNSRLHIDRKDNEVGYILGNMVLACPMCNRLKGAVLTEEEMFALARR